MRLTYTQAFEHLARKKHGEETDSGAKSKVIDILREKFGLHGLRHEVVRISHNSCRLPDLFIKTTNPQTVIELDGEIHGSDDEVSKRDKDKDRDSDYLSIGLRLIIINKEATNGYDPIKVINILKANGLKLL